MTKEQFTSLGLTEDLAVKAAAESEKELKDYIPKHRFDEVSTENKTLKDTVKKSETDLEELKKTAGDSAGLTEQIQKLQDAAKEESQKHQDELKEVKMMNAIKLAIAGKAQDEDLVAGLFDKTKLILGDDGK
ncbi:MAG: phage scaffolding protein, partial [Hungatella sp.]